MTQQTIPVLLGLDLNAYSMALSFYETFGLCSYAFGKYKCGITEHSRFVKTRIVKDMDREEIGVAALLSFAEKHKSAQLFLVPCSDWYMTLTEHNREILSRYFTFFIPPSDVFFRLSDKKRFYEALKEAGISYPKTAYIDSVFDLEKVLSDGSISYPCVLKPANSTCYYLHPFPDRQKVYFPKSKEETEKIAVSIFGSGYSESLIIQEYIDVQSSATLTVLVGNDRRIRRGVLGRILLEEKTKSARGNYAAIVTSPMDEISHRLLSFCQSVGYLGIGNFDILYGKDGKAYVLEMNQRQGRSCDYLRGCGISLAEFLTMETAGDNYPKKMAYPGIYWHCVSHKTVCRYASNGELLSLAERYRNSGFSFSPFHRTKDMEFRPIRAAYIFVHEKRRGAAFQNQKQPGGAL